MTAYLDWLIPERERLCSMPRPEMPDDAYHDFAQMLHREKDRMPADRLEWWVKQAIDSAHEWPHRLFRYCSDEAERMILAEYFPDAWGELQKQGADLMAQFEAKDSYLAEWKRHQEQQLEKIREEAAELRDERRLLRSKEGPIQTGAM